MNSEKFIIVKSDLIATQLIAHFKLLSHTNDVYIFINNPLSQFNFDNINLKDVKFTNTLFV